MIKIIVKISKIGHWTLSNEFEKEITIEEIETYFDFEGLRGPCELYNGTVSLRG